MSSYDISNQEIRKAEKIKQAVDYYFSSHPNQWIVPAYKLMPMFITRKIFTLDSQNGLPICEFLLYLHKKRKLRYVPQAAYNNKLQVKTWYFINDDLVEDCY